LSLLGSGSFSVCTDHSEEVPLYLIEVGAFGNSFGLTTLPILQIILTACLESPSPIGPKRMEDLLLLNEWLLSLATRS